MPERAAARGMLEHHRLQWHEDSNTSLIHHTAVYNFSKNEHYDAGVFCGKKGIENDRPAGE